MRINFLIGTLNVLTVNGMHGRAGCRRFCFGTYEAGADIDPNHRPGIDPPFRCVDIDECAKGAHHCDVHGSGCQTD